jgi:hypothetical protein
MSSKMATKSAGNYISKGRVAKAREGTTRKAPFFAKTGPFSPRDPQTQKGRGKAREGKPQNTRACPSTEGHNQIKTTMERIGREAERKGAEAKGKVRILADKER